MPNSIRRLGFKMAVFNDLKSGHEEAMRKIKGMLPNGADVTLSPYNLLGLVMLDMHYELYKPSNYILLAPCFTNITLLEIVDPRISRAMNTEVDDKEFETTYERITIAPFEIKVAYSPHSYNNPKDAREASKRLPAHMRGRVLNLRMMTTNENSKSLPPMLTVQADGSIIYLPNPNLPSHI